MKHHFWGDISAWFIKCLAGIQFNPNENNIKEVYIKPNFVTELDNAKGWYEAPDGKIISYWERKGEEILLKIEIPEEISATVYLPCGYAFDDGENTKILKSGEYRVKK
jgi:alpha-L-rhamnosidase